MLVSENGELGKRSREFVSRSESLSQENRVLVSENQGLSKRTDELVSRSESLSQQNQVLVSENEGLSEQLSKKEIAVHLDANAQNLATFGQMDSAQ